MDLKGLQGRIAAFGAERGWDHSPRILAMALAGEAGAVLGLFKWSGERPPDRVVPDPRVPSAIADVLLQSLRLADRLGIDLEAEMGRKLDEVAQRYPLPERPPAPAAGNAGARARPQGLREELQQAVARLGAQKAACGATGRTATESEARPRQAVRPASAPAARAPERPPAVAPPPPRAAAAQADPARPPAASSPPPRTTRPSTASAPPPRAPAPPSAASVPPAPASTPPPEADRYADLDTESVIALLKSLSRRVDGARSDDPLLRELHDELQTLRRTLYSSNTKPAWIGASLKTIHGLLEEATRHSVGEEIRAAEHLTHARSILRD